MSSSAHDFLLKIVMGGDSGVGKTNILSRFTQNKFLDESKSTIGAEFASRTITVKGADGNSYKVKCQVWDTAGQERYRAITRTYYRDSAACLLVFSLESKKSFKHLGKWIEEVRANSPDDVVIGLVANKKDLVTGPESAKRKVDAESIRVFADEEGLPLWVEASAKTGDGIEEFFTQLVNIVLKTNKKFSDKTSEKKSESVSLEADGGDGEKKKKCC